MKTTSQKVAKLCLGYTVTVGGREGGGLRERENGKKERKIGDRNR